jgi:hypothetical protein
MKPMSRAAPRRTAAMASGDFTSASYGVGAYRPEAKPTEDNSTTGDRQTPLAPSGPAQALG